MDIEHYIEILSNKKTSWFVHNDNIEERLTALIKISESGYPRIIHRLIPFLKDNNREIQNATCNTITCLFEKINTKKGYYETLRHCKISKSDIDFYENEFTEEQFIQLLAISSLNGDGHIREKAIKKLSLLNNVRSIPFIIYRLADWVPIVRQSALQGIEIYKKKHFIKALIDNLPLFEWIQKIERTNLSSVYNEIINFIMIENKKYILENFSSFSEKVRLLLAKHISSRHDIDSNELNLLLRDKHFLIRNLAFEHFDKLSQKEVNDLLKDKSPKIRIQVLYKLKAHDNGNFLCDFLTDKSKSIREYARYYLRNEITDFAIIYYDNLNKNKEIFASLCGLGETNGKRFAQSIEQFLQDPRIEIQKAAFLVLAKLNEQKAYEFAIINLDSEIVGIRKIAIEFLLKKFDVDVLEKARKVYKQGKIELKKVMLKMFHNIGGWITFTDIIIGTIDENEDIRNLSFDYLKIWETKAASLFMQPKADELKKIKSILNFAFEFHEDKKYFNNNPLRGLDFYLR